MEPPFLRCLSTILAKDSRHAWRLMSAEATIFVLPVYYLSKGFKACLEANVS